MKKQEYLNICKSVIDKNVKVSHKNGKTYTGFHDEFLSDLDYDGVFSIILVDAEEDKKFSIPCLEIEIEDVLSIEVVNE